ncbi:MAG: MFS transporter [bacterium]|nr:MFS transporter [bacterium]
MFKKFIKIMKMAPAIERLNIDKDELQRVYRYWRIRAFYSVFIGYAFFYICRTNLSIAMPRIIQDLGYSKTQMGIVTSLFYVTYAIAKFTNGVLCDKANPRYFMALGLFLASCVNIFFAFSPAMASNLTVVVGATISPIFFFALFWAINGYMQSMGSPMGPKVMSSWFSISERGTKYSVYNTCHNVGAFIIMAVGGWIVQKWGWQAGFYIPGMFCALGALFVVNRLRDRPESLGLPSVNEYRNDYSAMEKDNTKITDSSTLKEIAWHYVFSNYRIWLLAFASLFVYIIRYGLMDWAPTYLVEAKGSSIGFAGLKASVIELFGIPGGILAGMATDFFFKGRRIPVAIICLACLGLSATALFFVPPGHPILDTVLLAACGFFTYGPQMLIPGLAAIDFATRRAAGTAVGLTGSFSYFGAMVSGVGSGILIDKFGWNGGFYLWVGSALIAMFLVLPLWKAKALSD